MFHLFSIVLPSITFTTPTTLHKHPIALRIPCMPPISPSITPKTSYTTTAGRPNASNARKDVSPISDPIMEFEQHQTPSQVAQTGKRAENKSLSQILQQLTTNRLENGDVVIPSHLVEIVLALSLSMEETALKLNAMEEQLRLSTEATKRLDKIERQLATLTDTRTELLTQAPRTPPQNGLPAKPPSWTAAAMKGLKVTSTHTPQQAPPVKIVNAFWPSQVVIRSAEGKKPFEGLKSTEIVVKVNEALAQLDVKIGGRRLEVKGAASLPLGNVKLFTATKAKAEWLLENQGVWSTLADPELFTSPAIFPIIVDSVPMEFYSQVDVIKATLAEQNPIPSNKIHSIRWLSKPKPGQVTGSIVLNLLDKELMVMMSRGSVYFEGNSLRVRACKKTRVQCFRCQEPGHISLQCKNKQVCKHCGESHDSRACPSPKTENPHCVRCVNYDTSLSPSTPIDKTSLKYAHSASSANCPIRSKGLPSPPTQAC